MKRSGYLLLSILLATTLSAAAKVALISESALKGMGDAALRTYITENTKKGISIAGATPEAQKLLKARMAKLGLGTTPAKKVPAKKVTVPAKKPVTKKVVAKPKQEVVPPPPAYEEQPVVEGDIPPAPPLEEEEAIPAPPPYEEEAPPAPAEPLSGRNR